MMMNSEWLNEKSRLIVDKTKNYSPQEKVNVKLDYLIRLLTKLKAVILVDEVILKDKIDLVITSLPTKSGDAKISYTDYPKTIDGLKHYIQQTYKLYPKNHYRNVCLPLGISLGLPLGLPFGVALGNIAIGLPIGIPIGLTIGLAIGTQLDKKVAKENRVI